MVLVFSCINLNWVRPLYRKVEPRLNKLLVEGRLTMVSLTDLMIEVGINKVQWNLYTVHEILSIIQRCPLLRGFIIIRGEPERAPNTRETGSGVYIYIYPDSPLYPR